MTKKQLTRYQINWLLAITVLVASVLFFWYWYNNSYLNPERTFWSMINHNLQTSYVTRTSSQTAGQQSLQQVTDIQFVPNLMSRSTVTIENTETKEKVTTETIGTPNADFLRYTVLQTENGQNYSSVIGKWAVQKGTEQREPQILSDSLTGSILFFGNLNKSQREQLIKELQQTKAFKERTFIGETTKNSRKVFSYDVTVDLAAYAKVYKNYLKMIGQPQLAENIGNQQPGSTFKIKLDVNASSRRPASLIADAPNQKETFSNFGPYKPLQTPDTKLTVTELQQLLSGN
jgi:hypothetical protein